MSVRPAPPIASIPSLVVRSWNRFISYIDPLLDDAKKSRSDTSQAKRVIVCGNWKVVNRVLEARSHSYQGISKSCSMGNILTLTVWSSDAVRTRQFGKMPMPHEISVTGSVWSEKRQ